MSDAREAIRMQVMWNRLIAVVEEQAQALLHTAFGSVAREAGDLSAGVYDIEGRMLAQAVTGTPGHVNTMATAVAHFLKRFPIETMGEGDVFVTNDPWLGTGHLFDFVVVTPAFLGGRVVGLFACTCHVIDVGGRGFTADANSVYEEGTWIPHMHLRREGELNAELLAIIRANTRSPIEVQGDLLSLVSANDAGAARLIDMMAEFDLDSIEALADHILERSRTAALAALDEVPHGTYRADMTLDGYESPITLRAALTVNPAGLRFDYAGSSPASRYGINSPKCYTDAYTVFGLKCVIAPDVPNNAGSLDVFDIIAEPGSCVAPEPPSPVSARHVIGQMLPDLAFGCLAQALPGRVPAESAGSIWVLAMASAQEKVTAVGPRLDLRHRFQVMNVAIGGIGARPGKDGIDAMAFPSGVGTIPIEITESESPLVFWRKTILPGSGGQGRFQGGNGQVIEIGCRGDTPFTIAAATFDRIDNPARGRDGGDDGRPGRAYLASGEKLIGKTVHVVPAGDRLVVETPGGGGLGSGTPESGKDRPT
ncbi:MAG: hydantoinase B/oxoprolinase family protein [Geminicoccaceae bacterium]